MLIPNISALRVATGTAGEMDADIKEGHVMTVPTDDVVGADYFNLVSVEADIPCDLYKLDTVIGPIRQKINVGDQIAKIVSDYVHTATGYFLAVPKDHVPTDISEGQVWTFSAEQYYRTLHL